MNRGQVSGTCLHPYVYGYDGSIAYGTPGISNYTSVFGYEERISESQERFYEILDEYDEVNKVTTTPQGWTTYFNGERIVYLNTELKGA